MYLVTLGKELVKMWYLQAVFNKNQACRAQKTKIYSSDCTT